MHAVEPAAGRNVPAGHMSQDGCPVAFWKVPGLHGVGFAAPVEHEWPAGHTMQWAALVITGMSTFWYRPAGQGSGSAQPMGQKEPGSH